jgi:hypothetical protein
MASRFLTLRFVFRSRAIIPEHIALLGMSLSNQLIFGHALVFREVFTSRIGLRPSPSTKCLAIPQDMAP